MKDEKVGLSGKDALGIWRAVALAPWLAEVILFPSSGSRKCHVPYVNELRLVKRKVADRIKS